LRVVHAGKAHSGLQIAQLLHTLAQAFESSPLALSNLCNLICAPGVADVTDAA